MNRVYFVAMSLLVLLSSQKLQAQKEDEFGCWGDAYSIEEALAMKDSCRVFLTINEHGSSKTSTLIIGNSLSGCKNLGILGVGTNRFVKIKTNFSSFTYLEEFGIGGRIKRNVVNSSIKNCKNLARVGIGYTDSGYIFPKFLNYLVNDTVKVLLRYHFEDINIDKACKSLLKFLKRTKLKRLDMYTLKGLNLKDRKEELMKQNQFLAIVRIAKEKKIQLTFFGLQVGYNYDTLLRG